MVAEMFSWGEDKNYKISKGIVTSLNTVAKPKSRDKKKRKPWDLLDLEKHFNSKEYQQGQYFKQASMVWVPLIALFTGGTLSELVQLYSSDIFEKEGEWVIDINSGDDKELKVEGSDDDEPDGRPRIIPIHQQLIKLGFIDFVEHQQSKGEQKLFPDEPRNKNYKFDNFSKRFRYYRDKVGAGPRNDKEFRDFHSFRHLVRTNLEEIGVETGLIDDIIGHTSKDRSMGKQIYSHSELIKRKAAAIKKLNYPCIDFTKIRDWKHHKFKI
ncbi:site-specific integrase [Methyloprofundus sp.]|uniref:site-specific integrase n=1 Tax=Methyloprofundus sp. TaxID=2020875 RepID=UPI003D0BDF94